MEVETGCLWPKPCFLNSSVPGGVDLRVLGQGKPVDKMEKWWAWTFQHLQVCEKRKGGVVSSSGAQALSEWVCGHIKVGIEASMILRLSAASWEKPGGG